MKTRELLGAALNYAVAKARYPERPAEASLLGVRLFFGGIDGWKYYNPILSSYGDDIIDEYEITTIYLPADQVADNKARCWTGQVGEHFMWHSSESEYEGPTRRIAAMRAFVASKLGEEFEVPKELL